MQCLQKSVNPKGLREEWEDQGSIQRLQGGGSSSVNFSTVKSEPAKAAPKNHSENYFQLEGLYPTNVQVEHFEASNLQTFKGPEDVFLIHPCLRRCCRVYFSKREQWNRNQDGRGALSQNLPPADLTKRFSQQILDPVGMNEKWRSCYRKQCSTSSKKLNSELS